MLTLTPSAQKAVSRFIKGVEDPVAGLRIAVTGGGCSGMQYGMSLEEQGAATTPSARSMGSRSSGTP